MAYEAPVAVPDFLQAKVIPVDTSWLAQLPTDYRQGLLQQRQIDIANAGRDATPPGATSPDMGALTSRLMQLGAYDQAGQLMQLGIRQRLLASPSTLDNPLGTPASAAPASGSGFEPAVNRTLGFEGGLNPRDTNGTPSNYGINAAANPDVDVKNLTPNQARAIYKARYWDAIGGDSLPPALQGVAFDTAVIAGPGKAKELLVQSGGDPAKLMDLREQFQNNLLRSDPQKYGVYADAWSRRNADLRASIGGQPSTVAAYASQPSAAPAQAAIGAATGQPVRVASLGPVAAPGGPATAPQQPSFGAVNGAPTANSAQSQVVTPTEWAAKFNPADPTLAGKIADAVGIDPGEGVDVQDRNIRAAVIPVLQASRRATAAAAPTQQNTAPAQAGAPSTTVDQPASNVHPFGPGRIDAESGNPVAPFHAPAPVGGSVPPASAIPVSAPAGALRFVPPPAPSASSGGPDIPGLPANYQQPGGGQRYVNDILNMASAFEDAGLTGRAKVYMARAQQVQAQLEAAQKAQLDLQTRNAELTPEQKNFGVMRDQYNFRGSPLDLQGEEAQQKADARARANARYGLVETQQPDGTTVYLPRAQVLNGTAGGGSNGPVVKSQPAYVTQGQSALMSKLNDGATAYQERQIAGERLDALGNLLSAYQTGANSTAFNEAAANLRSFGLPVPNTATVNPAAMQEFVKNSYANVLASMREQGNKQFVSEVQSAINSNPNPDLQPEANQAMISQIKAVQDYRNQNYRDFADWYDGNKGASNDAKFQTEWAKANPLSRYVTNARKEIAPLGIAIPPADQRVVGQRYAVPGKGVFRWQGNGWSAN